MSGLKSVFKESKVCRRCYLGGEQDYGHYERSESQIKVQVIVVKYYILKTEV